MIGTEGMGSADLDILRQVTVMVVQGGAGRDIELLSCELPDLVGRIDLVWLRCGHVEIVDLAAAASPE